MKNLIFDGRLGKDCEIKTTKNGKQYLKFVVANNSFSNGETKTEWYDVTSFNEFDINNRSKVLKKGAYVIVCGDFSVSHNVVNGNVYLNTNVTANSIEVPSLGKRNENAAPAETVVSTYTPKTEGLANATVPDYSDDLPF